MKKYVHGRDFEPCCLLPCAIPLTEKEKDKNEEAVRIKYNQVNIEVY